MSDESKAIVSVKDLVVGIKDGESSDGYRFKINYGSFDINEGDFVLVKGRNGCGKSTFLRLFRMLGVNYFKVLSGDIFYLQDGFADKSINSYSDDELTKLSCGISYVGQEEKFLTFDSAYSYVYDLCRYALSFNKSLAAQRAERLKKVDELIREYYDKYLAASFQCKDYRTFKTKKAHSWSGGQQKMINVLAGIIKAQVCDLKLLIMDEPLNNLDGRNKDILNNLISEIRRNNVAVIAVTHCQIFDGVNKVLSVVEEEDGTRRATLLNTCVPAHSECLEDYH